MAEVRWTAQAAEDLDCIAQYIAKDSPHHASLFVANLLKAVERLASFPSSGRIVPEVNDPAIRETILGSYRLVYRVKEGVVVILTVHHGARLFDPSRIQ